MVAIATIQVLIEDSENASATLDALRQAALEVDGVKDARVQDTNGPVLFMPDMASRIGLSMGDYQPGQAFKTEHFCLPLNRTFETRSLDVGNLKLRMPMPMEDGRASIDLDVQVGVDSVTVELHPTGMPAGQAGSASTAALSFDRATQLVQGSRSASGFGGDVDGMRFRLIDNTTGRPIIGPVLTAMAVGAYTHASVVDGAAVLHGVHILQTFDDRFTPAVSMTDDSNAPQPMYFTDEGEMVGPSRIHLQEITPDSTKKA